MPKRTKPAIRPRKSPQQRRSTELVSAIVEAAIRVLEREGAHRFTTVRVAEEAGVSVGSLYQYFPNKAALLFRLQTDEWKETGAILDEILCDKRLEPFARLRKLVLVFFRSEREEAALRVALDDAQAFFRDGSEGEEHAGNKRGRLEAFIEEVLPGVAPSERAFAADFLGTSMSAIGERITSENRSRAEVDRWAKATAELYISFLETLRRKGA